MGRGDSLRSVNIGNVAEYNEQFFDDSFSSEHRESWRRESNHYACLASLYTPHPAVVVLPFSTDLRWIEIQEKYLEWDRVKVLSGFSGLLSESALSSHAVVGAVRAGAKVAPWGVSRQLNALVQMAGRGELCVPPRVVEQVESKVQSSRLFAELTERANSRIQVPRQFVTSTVEDAAALLARNSKNDQPSVIKSEFGVGGFGARTILPHEIGSEADALDTWRALANEDNIFGNRMLIVEDYIRGRSVKRDLTVDLVVDQEVEIKCVGEMLVEGTKYGGVNIGPHAVPEVEATAMREFGVLVGEAIMAIGYRGWFDIDFVAGRDGVLFPTEINARRTGPTIAHSIRERLRHTRPGRDYRVRTLDLLPLNRPIPEDELYAKLKDMTVVLRETCAVDMLPTLFTASEDDAPYFGVALIESVTPESALPFGALDDAESVLRSSALAF